MRVVLGWQQSYRLDAISELAAALALPFVTAAS